MTHQPTLSADGKLLAYSSDRAESGNMDIWVQQVDGGQPIRLTSDPAHDSSPALSPDGTEIAFVSSREPTGAYVMSALGGEPPRLLGEGAFSKVSYSPDGNWIAVTGFRGPVVLFRANGGAPREIRRDKHPAEYFHAPIWFPDSRRLLMLGSTRRWYVGSIDSALDDVGPTGPSRQGGLLLRSPEAWLSHGPGDRLVFPAESGDSTNLWSLPISRETGSVGEDLRQITHGTGRHMQPTSASDGTIAFTDQQTITDLWSICVDPNTGETCGELERLTEDLAGYFTPMLSRDGEKLLFASDRSGNVDVWIRDMDSGGERRLTFSDEDEDQAVVLSPDGETAIYRDHTAPESRNWTVSTEGGPGRLVCDDCRRPRSISTSGKLSLHAMPGSTLGAVNAEDGSRWLVVDCRDYSCYFGQFSPDERWVAFDSVPEAGGGRTVYIAPLIAGVTVPVKQWIRVTEARHMAGGQWWSADGNMLYFVSEADGNRCIWAQPLDSETKVPVGRARGVWHFHGSRFSPGAREGFTLSVGGDRMVLNLKENRGNVWLARPEP